MINNPRNTNEKRQEFEVTVFLKKSDICYFFAKIYRKIIFILYINAWNKQMFEFYWKVIGRNKWI